MRINTKRNVLRTEEYEKCRLDSVYNAFFMKYKMISSKVNISQASSLLLRFIMQNTKRGSPSYSLPFSSKCFLGFGHILVYFAESFRPPCVNHPVKIAYLLMSMFTYLNLCFL
jgi:hypothetical protein